LARAQALELTVQSMRKELVFGDDALRLRQVFESPSPVPP